MNPAGTVSDDDATKDLIGPCFYRTLDYELARRGVYQLGRPSVFWICPFSHHHDDREEAIQCVRIEALADHPRWKRVARRWGLLSSQ